MSGPQRGDTGVPPGAQWGSGTGSPAPSWAVGSIPGAASGAGPAQDTPADYAPTGDRPTGDRHGRQPARTGSAPSHRSSGWDLARALAVAVIALGLLNFIWGFLPELSLPRSTTTQGSLSVFGIGPAYVPILLLTAGLLAMTTFLPGEERSRFAVCAVSAGGAIGAIVSLGTHDAVSGFGEVSKGMGAVLLVIFGIIQAVVALTAFVIGSGLAVAPRSHGQGPRDSGPRDPAPTGAGHTAFTTATPPIAQSYPGQSYPGQSYPGQSYPGQPYPGQSYPGQPYPGQPYPDRGWAVPAGDWGGTLDHPADRPAGWGRAGYHPVPSPPGYPAGPGGPAPWEPSRSFIPSSADARSADTDPRGIPVVDPAGTPAEAGSASVPRVTEPPDTTSAAAAFVPGTDWSVPGPGEPGDDRPPPATAANEDPRRGS